MTPKTALYLAQIRAGRVEVYRDDSTRVDAFDAPQQSCLRSVLASHGWRPTSRQAEGGAWGAIVVEPIQA
ncbi:MAG TPA: hypothetical protein VKB55_15500 [Nocardioidaceae bacterium]|jgi:hypothetical protein|nr:hypothetical protein [Nocardioidaceae bacterium]